MPFQYLRITYMDQYYKTIFAVIELLYNYGKVLMHCVQVNIFVLATKD